MGQPLKQQGDARCRWLLLSALLLVLLAFCSALLAALAVSSAAGGRWCASRRAALFHGRQLPAWQRVPFDPAAPIPWHQLWQTSRGAALGPDAAAAAESWRRLNPRLRVTRHDDEAAAAFIDATYGPAVGATFRSFPLGVMRADFWRYAVLYARGGVYADTDVQCLAPLLAWLPPRPQQQGEPDALHPGAWGPAAGGLAYGNLTWSDCSLVVAMENQADFCQWVIASVPGHPVLASVIQLVLQRAAGGFDATFDHMVHKHTGPAVWTDAIRMVLQLPPKADAGAIARAAWTQNRVYRRARALGVCIMAASFFGGDHAQSAKNLYGSQNFKDEPSWLAEVTQLRREAREARRNASLLVRWFGG